MKERRQGNGVSRVQGQKQDAKKRKEEFELKRYRKHKLLRKYSKLCEREGIASERVRVPGVSTNSTNSSSTEKESGDSGSADTNKNNKKSFKKDLFEESKRIAEEKKRQHEEAQRLRLQKEKDIEEKEKQRAEKRKMHTQKTRKGQPVLNNQIASMLEKLKREKGLA